MITPFILTVYFFLCNKVVGLNLCPYIRVGLRSGSESVNLMGCITGGLARKNHPNIVCDCWTHNKEQAGKSMPLQANFG